MDIYTLIWDPARDLFLSLLPASDKRIGGWIGLSGSFFVIVYLICKPFRHKSHAPFFRHVISIVFGAFAFAVSLLIIGAIRHEPIAKATFNSDTGKFVVLIYAGLIFLLTAVAMIAGFRSIFMSPTPDRKTLNAEAESLHHAEGENPSRFDWRRRDWSWQIWTLVIGFFTAVITAAAALLDFFTNVASI